MHPLCGRERAELGQALCAHVLAQQRSADVDRFDPKGAGHRHRHGQEQLHGAAGVMERELNLRLA